MSGFKEAHTRSNSSRNDELERRDFLKKVGLLTGGTAMGLLGTFRLQACGNPARSRNQILVPNMHGMTYWEMLMFSCLQGLMNRTEANVFFYYPEKSREGWYSKYPVEDERVFYNWYKKYEHLKFEEIDNPYTIFDKIHSNKSFQLNGCVIVDTEVPATANIGANYASIENLLPVTETILKSNKGYLQNLTVKRDLRGQFQGMSKLEIYEWAFEQQWPQANHARVANLGTPTPMTNGNIPTNSFHTSNRARDFTVAEQGFFFELASKGNEYTLKDRILQAMEPRGYVFGWHQGAGEENHIRHLSKHGQLALGTSTYAANFSFHSRVRIPGAVERFRQKAIKTSTKPLENKIYLTFVLSDGDSLNFLMRRGQGGQWQLPERGKIPFGWEIQPLLADVAPGILDYFQATATENDFFVNGVSGIGYFYPEEMPKDKLRGVLNETGRYIKMTGLSELTVMSPSGAVTDETSNVYREVLGGQLNGVMEGYERRKAKAVRLFDCEGGKSTVWLPTSNPKGEKSVENWVAGLKEIAKCRMQRPLFVPLHVPAHKLTITDMVKVVGNLGEEFEVVAPRTFYKLFAEANSNSILIEPPESFPMEKVELIAGSKNTLTPTLQNLSQESKTIEFQLTIISEDLDKNLRFSKSVGLESRQTSQVKFEVDIPKQFCNTNGQLEYGISTGQRVLVPVRFL
ncbi:GxGYxYP domain-containing protein [Gaoshiqia sediminis]|uniref:GxGYxYP family putative glycoside hydrolase n=1 Tax=Gaoshiqia sediminis TaxID=2986998 RepID=A0AA42CAS2_9BACT|nr:GxGYxYP domain-containing protein [Gaoshiqia sediminis]MCW0483920.1 GxGYxYP family putative glycoside hydrolase [Gaoshiqia sediminis]